MRRGDRTLVAVLVAAAALLAGCAGIPTSGGIVEGGPVRADDPAPYVRYYPPDPRRGDTETQLVEGWFDAMAAYDPGNRTVSRYLSARGRSAWEQGGGTVVYDALTRQVEQVSPGRVEVTLAQVARIGADGRYLRTPTGASVRLDLDLVREHGQWRIDDPPAGLYMSEFNVERELEAYDVYFPSADGQVLVPEQVYLPVNGAVPTLLVQSLLQGPSRQLAPAVSSPFPAEAELSSPSVVVADGIAQVDLTVSASDVPERQRDLISAALVWTLGQVASVRGLRLTLDGVPVVVGGASATGVQSMTSWRRFDPTVTAPDRTVYALSGRKVVAVGDADPRPVAGPLGTGALGGLRSVAVDLGRDAAAAVTADGRRLLVAGLSDSAGAAQVLLTGTDLGPPSYDRLGRVWVVDSRAGGAVVQVAAPGRSPVRVPVEGLAGADVRRLRVARDGVRVAMVVERDRKREVVVGVVVGDLDGNDPLRVVANAEVTRVRGALDVGWSDPTELAVLARDPDAGQQLELVALSGASLVSRGSVPGAVEVAVAPGEPPVLATTSGELYRLGAAQQWTPAADAVAPAYPG